MRVEDYAIMVADGAAAAVEENANVLHAVLSQQLGDRFEDGVPRFQWSALPGGDAGQKWWLRVYPERVDRDRIAAIGGRLIRAVEKPADGATVFYSVDYCADASGRARGAPGLISRELEAKAREILGQAFAIDEPGAFECRDGLQSRIHGITGQSRRHRRYYLRVSGVARVHDSERLDYFIQRGLGRGRGYGFGLLIVEPVALNR